MKLQVNPSHRIRASLKFIMDDSYGTLLVRNDSGKGSMIKHPTELKFRQISDTKLLSWGCWSDIGV